MTFLFQIWKQILKGEMTCSSSCPSSCQLVRGTLQRQGIDSNSGSLRGSRLDLSCIHFYSLRMQISVIISMTGSWGLPRIVPGPSYILTNLILTTTLQVRWYYYLLYINKETETQRANNLSKFQSLVSGKDRFSTQAVWFRAHDLNQCAIPQG